MTRPNVGDLFPIGAEGDAQAGDVLSGKTFSNEDETGIAGSMPNRATSSWHNQQGERTLNRRVHVKPPAGYYDGNTEVRSNYQSGLLANNIREGVTLFGITGTANVVDDTSGSPGGTGLIAGTMDAGYFGTHTGIFTGNGLSSTVGFTAGDLFSHYNSKNIEWFKFAYQGKVIFVAQKPIRYAFSFNNLVSAGVVYGKNASSGGITYKCRLMTGASSDPYNPSGQTGSGSEWNTLLYQIHGPGGWAQFTSADLYVSRFDHIYGWRTHCQETSSANNRVKASRGHDSIEDFIGTFDTDSGGQWGWRPVLEVVT